MAELLSLVPAKSLETDVVVGEASAVCPLPPVTVSNDTLLISLIDRLRRTLENHRSENQIVVMQDFPDPDALSSAWAYQIIAEQYDIHCDIVYAGTLSHQENVALVKLTGLPAKRWGALWYFIHDYNAQQSKAKD